MWLNDYLACCIVNRTETAINFYIICMGLFHLSSLALSIDFLANQEARKLYQILDVVICHQFYRRRVTIESIM